MRDLGSLVAVPVNVYLRRAHRNESAGGMILAERVDYRHRRRVGAAMVSNLVEGDGPQDFLAVRGKSADFGWIAGRRVYLVEPVFPISRLRVACEQELLAAEREEQDQALVVEKSVDLCSGGGQHVRLCAVYRIHDFPVVDVVAKDVIAWIILPRVGAPLPPERLYRLGDGFSHHGRIDVLSGAFLEVGELHERFCALRRRPEDLRREALELLWQFGLLPGAAVPL